MRRDLEKAAGGLLAALKSADPSWELARFDGRLALAQDRKIFCKGRGRAELLSDFVEACRHPDYVRTLKFRIPGMLAGAGGVDELLFRLEALT